MGDIWDQLANYRKVKMLADGSRLLLRPLQKEDKQALVRLFSRATSEDLKWFHSDAGNPAVVEEWVDDLDYEEVFPLIAFVNDQLVGDATLHFGEHHHGHVAYLRIFLDKEYRRRGIGTLMLQSLIEIAQKVGLQRLYAQVVSIKVQALKAFKDLGFYREAVLEDYFITSGGVTYDVEILVLPLVETSGTF